MSPHPSIRPTKKNLVPIKQKGKQLLALRPDRKWAVYFYEQKDGRPTLCRKFFREQATAEEFCMIKRAEQNNLGAANAIGLSDGLKQEALACWRKLEPLRHLGATLTKAVDYYIKDAGLAAKSKSVAEAAAACVEAKRRKNLSLGHLKRIRQTLEQFCTTYGKAPISTMKAATVKAWLEAYAEKHDLNEVSYNAKKRYLSLFFGHCVDSDLLESNPADKVEAREEDGRRKRVMRPGDLRKWLAAASPAVRTAISIQAFCGCRTAEVARLRWADINWKDAKVVLEADIAKIPSRRSSPIPPNLFAYLMKVRKEDDCLIWEAEQDAETRARYQSKPPKERAAMLDEWRIHNLVVAMTEARESAAPIEWQRNALRVSAASYWFDKTKDAAATASAMGHDPDTFEDNYKDIIRESDMTREWFEIDPANPMKAAKVIAFRPKVKRRKAE